MLDGDKLRLNYLPSGGTTDTPPYVRPSVLLEFGTRSRGNPDQEMLVRCDASGHVPSVVFPTATPRVMAAERTLWEKVTAVHVFCRQHALSGERLARHWYDISRLDRAGKVATALADRALALQVARHKGMFFTASVGGQRIDHEAAISGSLQLVLSDDYIRLLENDYNQMLAGDLLLDPNPESFRELMAHCADIADRINTAGAVYVQTEPPKS